MRPRIFARFGLVLDLGARAPGRLGLPDRTARAGRISDGSGPAASSQSPRAGAEPLKNEIPPGELEPVMAAHFKGLGYMEQYEYREAVEAFREVHRRAPGWIPARSTWRSHS